MNKTNGTLKVITLVAIAAVFVLGLIYLLSIPKVDVGNYTSLKNIIENDIGKNNVTVTSINYNGSSFVIKINYYRSSDEYMYYLTQRVTVDALPSLSGLNESLNFLIQGNEKGHSIESCFITMMTLDQARKIASGEFNQQDWQKMTAFCG